MVVAVTPEERAKKIADMITPQIREAQEQGRKESHDCSAESMAKAFKQGQAAAYEDAASIAELPLCKNDSHCEWIRSDIASRIRARAKDNVT